MLINETHFIDSCDDIEINVKRTSKLEYRITYDDEKEMKAIVFIIGGYGANANIYFLDSYRKFIAKKFGVVTINVFYHGFCQMKSNDEKYDVYPSFNKDDIHILENILIKYNLLNGIRLDQNNLLYYYGLLDKQITILKEQKLLYDDFKETISCDLAPTNDEYQNFGIMAAIDHINALKDIFKNYPKFKSLPKIYGGGSYGGYISCLIAKIAPWYVDGVIDNSASALPPLNYVIGRDFGIGDSANFDNNNFFIKFYPKTYWTRKDPNSPYYFKDENYLIRALLNQTHLILQAQKNKDIIYINYHSLKDDLTPAEYKIQMCEILKALNYDITFHLIDEKDIDGKFIKNLEHGCGIPDKALFNKELPIMLEKLKDKKIIIKEDSISYPCKNKVFTFKDEGDKFVLEIV